MVDCAFKRGRYCCALKEKYCKNCTFKKTVFELEEGRRLARERIYSLPVEQQNHIREKYHSVGDGEENDE